MPQYTPGSSHSRCLPDGYSQRGDINDKGPCRMTLGEILEKCKGLEISEKRTVGEEYCEVVFLRKDDDKLSAIFNDALGAPVKPKGQAPTKDDAALTKKFGGIMKDQTLFKKDFGGEKIIAMFWPWQDGLSVTLKIARVK